MSDFMLCRLNNFLNDNGVTFNEANELLNDALVSIKQTRAQVEYDTIQDYFTGKKSCDVGNEIIPRMDIEKIKEICDDIFDEIRKSSTKSEDTK